MSTPPAPAAPPAPKRYHAFLSYSHAFDRDRAAALQKALHVFAKPLFKLRALRLFRDSTNLSATPGLWASIRNALDDSSYLVLYASSASARSTWVKKELDHWLASHAERPERVLLVLTGGTLGWDDDAGDIDWSTTDAIPMLLDYDGLEGPPRTLWEKFTEVPLFVDLRWAQDAGVLSLRNPKFLDAVATLAATLHGREKDELVGSEVSLQRRTRRLAGSAVVTLALFAAGAIREAYIARVAERRAEENLRLAVAQQALTLASEPGSEVSAVATALDAVVRGGDRSPVGAPVAKALSDALGVMARAHSLPGTPGGRFVGVADDGSRVVTIDHDGLAAVWSDEGGEPIERLRGPEPGGYTRASFSPDARQLILVGGQGSKALLHEVGGGKPDSTLDPPDGERWVSASFSPSAKHVVLVSDTSGAHPKHVVRLFATQPASAGRLLRESDESAAYPYFSEDGEYVVTTDTSFNARFWRTSDGQLSARVAHFPGRVALLERSQGERLVATAAEVPSSVRPQGAGPPTSPVVDIAPASGLSNGSRTFEGPDPIHLRSPVTAVAGNDLSSELSPGAFPSPALIFGVTVLTNPERVIAVLPNAAVVNLVSGAEVKSVTGHRDRVTVVAFSRRTSRLVTGGADRMALLWHGLDDGHAIELRGHDEELSGAAISATGETVVTATPSGRTRVWNGAASTAVQALVVPGLLPRTVEWSPSGDDFLVVGDDDSTYHRAVLLLRTNGAVRWRDDSSETAGGAAFSKDGKRVFSFDENGGVARVLDAASGKRLDDDSRPTKCAVGRDTVKGPVRVRCEEAAWVPLERSESGLSEKPELQFFRNDALVAANDGRIWDTRDGRGIAWLGPTSPTAPPFHASPWIALENEWNRAFVTAAPNGRRIAVSGPDRVVRIYAADDSALGWRLQTMLIGHKGGDLSADYAPDGTLLDAHDGSLRHCSFSADSHRVLTGATDGTARLWDAETGDPLATLFGHLATIDSTSLSSDGRHVATVSASLGGVTGVRVDRRILIHDVSVDGLMRRACRQLPGYPEFARIARVCR